jgi:hypothetical protein
MIDALPYVLQRFLEAFCPERLQQVIDCVCGVAGDSKIYLGRIFAEGPETRFTLPVPAAVKRLIVDPYQTVLTAP